MKAQLREFFVVLMVFTPFGSSHLTTISIGNSNSPETGVICKSKPDGTLLPINGDCSHYWYCSAGKAIKLPCTPGMEFSPTARECVRIELSDCDQTNVNTTYPATYPTTPTTTTEDQPNLPPGITKNPCTKLPNQIRHPYPFNCSAFMRCVDNEPVLEYCPFDKIFNPIILVCDDADDTECQEVEFPEESIDAFANRLDTVTAYDICDHQPISKKIAYPEKCKKYIACDHPVPIAYYCCDNLAFNCVFEICDIPENVACSADASTTAAPRTTVTVATTPTTPTTTPRPENPNSCHVKSVNSFVPYPNNCEKYIQCTIPIPIAGYCSNGYKFNELFEICDLSEDVHCSMETISTFRIPKI